MVDVLIIIIVILVVVLMKNKADQNSEVDKNFTNITSRGTSPSSGSQSTLKPVQKPVSQPQVSSMGNLKTEERLAKNVVDAHFSGNDANFKYFSDMLSKDAAM